MTRGFWWQLSGGMAVAMLGVSVAIILFVMFTPKAFGRDTRVLVCHETPQVSDEEPRWAWRTVDGRRCWYAGAKKRPVTLLHWPEGPALAAEPEEEPEPALPVEAAGEPIVVKTVRVVPVESTPPQVDEIIKGGGERVRFPIERWWGWAGFGDRGD